MLNKENIVGLVVIKTIFLVINEDLEMIKQNKNHLIFSHKLLINIFDL